MKNQYRIVSVMNGKALTVSNGQRQTRPFDLIIEEYVNSLEQKFVLDNLYDNQYTVRSAAYPDKVIDVMNESKDVYKQILVYESHGKPNQKWIIADIANKGVQFISMHSGLVLQIQGGIDADGMLIVQNTNYQNKSQVWRIQQV